MSPIPSSSSRKFAAALLLAAAAFLASPQLLAQSRLEPGFDQPWISGLDVYRPVSGERNSPHVDPELEAIAEQGARGDLHVLLELGAMALPDDRESLAARGVELLERLRPKVWLATFPLGLVRDGLPVEVRSVRLLRAEDKLSDEIRLGHWGPYGLLRQEGMVPLRLALHRDAEPRRLADYLAGVFDQEVHSSADGALELAVPVHLVLWVAEIDAVRSVELNRDAGAG